jgi:hypothetical protein
VRTSTPAPVQATEAHVRRHDGRRISGSHPRLIDTRLVRAELLRLRGPHPALLRSRREMPAREASLREHR